MNRLPGLIFRMSITHEDTVQCAWRSLSGPNVENTPFYGLFRSEIAAATLALHEQARRKRLNSAQIAQLGEDLFNSLFVDRVCDEFIAHYQKIRNQEDEILRLELEIDERHASLAAALPWEFMSVPPQVKKELGKVDLATTPKMALLRRKWGSKTVDTIRLAEGETLRIAFIVSSPGKLGAVKYQSIKQRVDDLKKELGRPVEVHELVDNVRLAEIEQIIRAKPHILHFIGHARASGKVALNDITPERPRWIDAEFFCELLNGHTPRIIVFQACESAMISGVLPRILEKDIPVTIAMHYKVRNATAQTFALKFYECLMHNDTVEVAVQEGRRSISLSNEYRTSDFAIPVIYSQVSDGRLFPPGAQPRKRSFTPEQQAQFQLALVYRKKIGNGYKALQKDRETLVLQARIGESQCKKTASHMSQLLVTLQNLLSVLNRYAFVVPYELTLEIQSLLLVINVALFSTNEFCKDCKLLWVPTYTDRHERTRKQLAGVLDKLHPLLSSIDKFLKDMY